MQEVVETLRAHSGPQTEQKCQMWHYQKKGKPHTGMQSVSCDPPHALLVTSKASRTGAIMPSSE